jgi:hypothetical protein
MVTGFDIFRMLFGEVLRVVKRRNGLPAFPAGRPSGVDSPAKAGG